MYVPIAHYKSISPRSTSALRLWHERASSCSTLQPAPYIGDIQRTEETGGEKRNVAEP